MTVGTFLTTMKTNLTITGTHKTTATSDIG